MNLFRKQPGQDLRDKGGRERHGLLKSRPWNEVNENWNEVTFAIFYLSNQYSFLENPHGQRSLEGYSPWGHKESDMTEQLSTA